MNRRIDHTQVQLAFLSGGGESAVDKLIEIGVSDHILKRAWAELLRSNEPEGVKLGEVLKKHGIVKPRQPRRGPARPQHGETRNYSVQCVEGLEFFRCPVGILSAIKRSILAVTFEDDVITVRLKSLKPEEEAHDYAG